MMTMMMMMMMVVLAMAQHVVVVVIDWNGCRRYCARCYHCVVDHCYVDPKNIYIFSNGQYSASSSDS